MQNQTDAINSIISKSNTEAYKHLTIYPEWRILKTLITEMGDLDPTHADLEQLILHFAIQSGEEILDDIIKKLREELNKITPIISRYQQGKKQKFDRDILDKKLRNNAARILIKETLERVPLKMLSKNGIGFIARCSKEEMNFADLPTEKAFKLAETIIISQTAMSPEQFPDMNKLIAALIGDKFDKNYLALFRHIVQTKTSFNDDLVDHLKRNTNHMGQFYLHMLVLSENQQYQQVIAHFEANKNSNFIKSEENKANELPGFYIVALLKEGQLLHALEEIIALSHLTKGSVMPALCIEIVDYLLKNSNALPEDSADFVSRNTVELQRIASIKNKVKNYPMITESTKQLLQPHLKKDSSTIDFRNLGTVGLGVLLTTAIAALIYRFLQPSESASRDEPAPRKNRPRLQPSAPPVMVLSDAEVSALKQQLQEKLHETAKQISFFLKKIDSIDIFPEPKPSVDNQDLEEKLLLVELDLQNAKEVFKKHQLHNEKMEIIYTTIKKLMLRVNELKKNLEVRKDEFQSFYDPIKISQNEIDALEKSYQEWQSKINAAKQRMEDLQRIVERLNQEIRKKVEQQTALKKSFKKSLDGLKNSDFKKYLNRLKGDEKDAAMRSLEAFLADRENILQAMFAEKSRNENIIFNNKEFLCRFVFSIWESTRQNIHPMPAPQPAAGALLPPENNMAAVEQLPPLEAPKVAPIPVDSGALTSNATTLQITFLPFAELKETSEAGPSENKLIAATDLWYKDPTKEAFLQKTLGELKIIAGDMEYVSERLNNTLNQNLENIDREAYRRTLSLYLVKIFEKVLGIVKSVTNGPLFVNRLINYIDFEILRNFLAHHTFTNINNDFDEVLIAYAKALVVLTKIDLELINKSEFEPLAQKINVNVINFKDINLDFFRLISKQKFGANDLNSSSNHILRARLERSRNLINAFNEATSINDDDSKKRDVVYLALLIEITTVREIYRTVNPDPPPNHHMQIITALRNDLNHDNAIFVDKKLRGSNLKKPMLVLI